LLDAERGPGARDASGRLQRAHRPVRRSGPSPRAPGAHRREARLGERRLLLSRLAGGLAGRVGRGRPHVRAAPRRRVAHPVQGRRPRAAGRDRAPHRQPPDRSARSSGGTVKGSTDGGSGGGVVATGAPEAREGGGRDGNGSGPTLELSGVRKQYGDFVAVKGLDLRAKRGEIFGFLGPNGAGKTTTIRMVAGVLRPTGGRILIGGIDIDVDPEGAKAKVGYIPDRPYLYEKLSGGEFLRFVAGLWGWGAAEADARADRLLELFDLADWKDELIESYSHGMRQKVLISSAL